MEHPFYCEKMVSRRKALEAATQVVFHRRGTREQDMVLSRPALRHELEDMGLGPVTSAEMSDIWRHSTYFSTDLDIEMADGGTP